jgi:Domain of unknown function (DUF4419)
LKRVIVGSAALACYRIIPQHRSNLQNARNNQNRKAWCQQVSRRRATGKCKLFPKRVFGLPTRGTWHVLSSSFTPDTYYKRNGFVDTILDAYNRHHHLSICPDDVWIAIISGLSLHINSHAEELRAHFVSHERQEELTLDLPPSSLERIYWDSTAGGFAALLDQKLVDKEFKDWITPSFSTTTQNDKTVSAMVVMASMKKYFTYSCEMLCGIPSVTLEGTKDDWVNIQSRLVKLTELDTTTFSSQSFLNSSLRLTVKWMKISGATLATKKATDLRRAC